MKPPAAAITVEAYIAGCPVEVQPVLRAIRETVRQAAPLAVEKIGYGMPTFAQGRVIVHFGAFKGHIGLFPPVREPDLLDRARPYAGKKGNLRFPLDQPIPHDLIADIVRRRVEQVGGRG